MLKRKGVLEIDKIRVDTQPELRDEMINKTGRRSVPQIFINGEHVGGFDDLAMLDQEGRLEVLLGK